MMVNNSQSFAPLHVSVDCVILGFDGDSLQVLLSHQSVEAPEARYDSLKLPGRLIYSDEDIADAADNIINQLTGTRNHFVQQFRTFGSPTRVSDAKELEWLQNAIGIKIGRIVTVVYWSLVKINNRTHRIFAGHDCTWYKIPELDLNSLAYDHGHIITEVLKELDRESEERPELLGEMLPAKFTALQLRRLHEQIVGHEIDVRNFSKLELNKPYIKPLDEWEQNASHRPARYYKFQNPKGKQQNN